MTSEAARCCEVIPYFMQTLLHLCILLRSECEDTEEKLQFLNRQLEMKNMEAQRFKTAAEVAKVSEN